jgi:hypothetical protein
LNEATTPSELLFAFDEVRLVEQAWLVDGLSAHSDRRA